LVHPNRLVNCHKGWNKDGFRPFSEKIQLYLGWKSSVFKEVSSTLDGNFPFWQKNRDVVYLNQTENVV
jgi:hypothetical protein